METILVTGGSGLVGNAMKTISQNYKSKYNFTFVSSKDFNLLQMYQTITKMQKYKPTYVIHLA